MKRCSKCKEEKELESFPKDKQRKDGYYPQCKFCVKNRYEYLKTNEPEKIKQWRKSYNQRHRLKLIDYRIKYYGENREDILRNQREAYQKRKNEISIRRAKKKRTEEARAKSRVYSKRSREKTGNAIKHITRWKKDNPKKATVHAFVLWAVRAGVMQRPITCQECLKQCKTQAHHDDYDKPMEVIWLCSVCHGEKHRKYR